MQGNATHRDEKTSISSLVIRNTLQPCQLPSPDAQLSEVHIHNLKRDGVSTSGLGQCMNCFPGTRGAQDPQGRSAVPC